MSLSLVVLVCKLRKAVYGLKQAPRAGNVKIIVLYVDDMLLIGPNEQDIPAFKDDLDSSFEME